MSLATNSEFNKGALVGYFVHKETGAQFEYSSHEGEFPCMPGATHLVHVNDLFGYPYRAAKVLKTVAYIATDEDDFGNPVWEKWRIKHHRIYRSVAC